ncbi:FadR/GntR family transcriptional regulator [Planctomicrobium sp. SH661]|uniref:FadR/GntR family transcriptional regulator n=1 Tax=Planctomicrobium sp. SH661 TaxID=3448124 RepID=UPI003F5C8797
MKLAATHRNENHLEQMREAQQVIQNSQSSINDLVAADLEFHSAFADASGNPLFDVLLVPIQKLLIQNHFRTFARLGSSCTVEEHEAILNAVSAQDGVAAARAMRLHLRSVIEHVQQIISGAEPAEPSGISVWTLSADLLKGQDATDE